MEKCSFTPGRCLSYTEALRGFDNPGCLPYRLDGLTGKNFYELAEKIDRAIKRHNKLRAYCDKLGVAALTTCAIHQNPDNIPIDQGLWQLYRYNQPSGVALDTVDPKHPESMTEVTILFTLQDRNGIYAIDPPTGDIADLAYEKI